MIDLYTVEQVRGIDNYAISELSIPGLVLMENAAISICEYVEEYLENAEGAFVGEVLILCGKGNNGGDGFAVARHLVNRGFRVKVIPIFSEDKLKGDAKINYEIIKKLSAVNELITIDEYDKTDLQNYSSSSVIIDAMLGSGAKGDLRMPFVEIVEQLNSFSGVRIAIDIPTGLNTDLGTGKVIFNADLTITLAGLKQGLFFSDGYKNCGEVVKAGIGVSEEYFCNVNTDTYLVDEEDALEGLPIKQINLHKYNAGRVLAIAGSGRYPGAAVYTANAAINSGAGSVMLAFPRSIKNVAQLKLHNPVLHPYTDHGKEYFAFNNIEELDDTIVWADVIAVGPGLGREKETLKGVKNLLEKYPFKQFVLDADAIYALKDYKNEGISLKGAIVTPHIKEFSALIGKPIDEINRNLLEYGRKFATDSKAYLVLKGAPSIIFTPEGKAFVNSNGNVGMAKFGSGDVLTGIIASFLSQSSNITNALLSAVYMHSLSADLLLNSKTEYCIGPELIIENFSQAVKKVRNELI